MSGYRVGEWWEFIGIPEPDDGTTRYYKGKIVAVETPDDDTTVLTLQQWPHNGLTTGYWPLAAPQDDERHLGGTGVADG